MLTFVLTIFGGFLTFTFGQIFLKLVIEPAQEFKKALGRTSHTLLVHQAKLISAHSDENIALEIKQRSAEIASQIDTISWYQLAQLLFSLPDISAVDEASRQLNLLRYGMTQAAKDAEEHADIKTDFPIQNYKAMKEIEKLLHIKTLYESVRERGGKE
ncbi:MAG: hypothetical protein PHC99_07940 [Methylococcales bacterium]|nr:hypothetical protein [Methylococcales bacterium]